MTASYLLIKSNIERLWLGDLHRFP